MAHNPRSDDGSILDGDFVADPVNGDAPLAGSGGAMRRLAKNSAANIVRLGITSVIAILLPAYLTHRLPVETYGVWVLVLQMGAYVSYLDFGVQTAVAKYIAEHDARKDYEGCGQSASAGFAVMLGAAVLGILLTLALAWRAPYLFHNIPATLIGDARLGILFVGISLSLGLPASVLMAIFLGLQRYQIPMITIVATRLLYAAAIIFSVKMHSGLAGMGAAVAISNVIGMFLQIGLWKSLASHVKVSLKALDPAAVREMLQYCSALTVWLVCMLFITGLDVAIVGRYAFLEVAFYSIATAPTNLMVTIIGAALGPLLPAASALSVERSPEQLSKILVRTTRYITVLLLLTGLPLIVGGYVVLKLWVGQNYAVHSIGFLRVLVLANIVRYLGAPYSTMVLALSRPRFGIPSTVVEALVNVTCSIWLVKDYGAIGVALGTLVGSVVGLGMHFGVTMRYTQRDFSVSRFALFFKGMMRPAAVALPSVLLFPLWRQEGAPSMHPWGWAAWSIATLLLAWSVGLSSSDRGSLLHLSAKYINSGAA